MIIEIKNKDKLIFDIEFWEEWDDSTENFQYKPTLDLKNYSNLLLEKSKNTLFDINKFIEDANYILNILKQDILNSEKTIDGLYRTIKLIMIEFCEQYDLEYNED